VGESRRCARCDREYDAAYDACPHCARKGQDAARQVGSVVLAIHDDVRSTIGSIAAWSRPKMKVIVGGLAALAIIAGFAYVANNERQYAGLDTCQRDVLTLFKSSSAYRESFAPRVLPLSAGLIQPAPSGPGLVLVRITDGVDRDNQVDLYLAKAGGPGPDGKGPSALLWAFAIKHGADTQSWAVPSDDERRRFDVSDALSKAEDAVNNY
jgi:hypothetical protein